MGPKEWTEEDMLFVEEMHIAEETERLERNSVRADGGDNIDEDIPDEQDDDLVI